MEAESLHRLCGISTLILSQQYARKTLCCSFWACSKWRLSLQQPLMRKCCSERCFLIHMLTA